MATMLYAVTVPPEGSDTLIADCVAAWDALPPERQEALEARRCTTPTSTSCARANTAPWS